MRLATRRLHALDNVAPLTFPVCGVCEKAILAAPYEVDGKMYHQGGCLIELGHRVTEEIWKAKELARVAAAERAKMDYPIKAPGVTYQPFVRITDGTTSIPAVGPYYYGNGVNIPVGVNIPAGWTSVDSGSNGSGDYGGNTIFLPANLMSTSGALLDPTVVTGTATAVSGLSHNHASSSHTHTVASSTWDSVAIADGEAVEFTTTVTI